jgi:hypothetical protein
MLLGGLGSNQGLSGFYPEFIFREVVAYGFI